MAGTEGSIIIDGTEHCPGKQGVNLISLDFVNYKYSKGRVIRPEELQAFVASHFESWKKSDPVFVVTQGDCTVLFEGSVCILTLFFRKFPFDSLKNTRKPKSF